MTGGLASEALPQRASLATYMCDLDAGDAGADYALLSPAEQARADRFHFPRDRDRYVVGRAFLRRRLAETLDQPAAGLALIHGPWGKPALACGSVEFNLSHSGGVAVLAVSRTGPVGVDVELIDRTVDITALSESCFLPSERAMLDGLDTPTRRTGFFALWTAKEAVMKLNGQGMSLPPLEIELTFEAGWPVGCQRPHAHQDVRLIYFSPRPPGSVSCLAIDKRNYHDPPFRKGIDRPPGCAALSQA